MVATILIKANNFTTAGTALEKIIQEIRIGTKSWEEEGVGELP